MSRRAPDPGHRSGAPRQIAWVIGLIAVIVFPAAASLIYFQVTKDPSLRPLGVTRAAEQAYARGQAEDGSPLEIVVRVYWVPDHAGGHSHISLQDAFLKTFAAKGIDAVSVRFLPGRTRTTITYVVGKSIIGPIPVEQAAQGVNAAAAAFRMSEADRQRFVNGD